MIRFPQNPNRALKAVASSPSVKIRAIRVDLIPYLTRDSPIHLHAVLSVVKEIRANYVPFSHAPEARQKHL